MVAATVLHSLSMTSPDNPAYENNPSDWNKSHLVTLSLGPSDVLAISAGASSQSTGQIVFANSNSISFGLNAGTMTASGNFVAGVTGISAFSAGTTLASSGTVSLANGSGVSFGMAGNTLTASVKTDYQTSGAYLTTAALSQDSSKYAGTAFAGTNITGTLNTSGLSLSVPAPIAQTSISYANSNGVTFGTVGSTLTASVQTNYQTPGAYLTTAALSQDSSKYAGINGAITGGSITVNTSGVSVALPAYLTTARASNDGVGLATAQTNVTWTVNSAGVSLNAGGYAGTGTAATSASVTLDTSGISIAIGPYLTTARRSTDALGLATAGTNITWTANSAGVSIDAGGYAGTGTTLGNTVGTIPAMTLNSNGLSFLNPEPLVSSFQNMYPFLQVNAGNAQNLSSKSAAIAFQLPQAGSFSFVRLPVSMATNSTTVASNATLTSGGGFVYSTWNAVVYAMGAGASSQSLISVASGSAPFTVMNSYNFNTANSAWSITQGITGQAYGNQFTSSSLGSQTTASANFSSNWATRMTGNRFLDVNFANSLSAGPYWLLVGGSTSSTTSGQGAANLTLPGASLASAWIVTQGNIWLNAINDTLGSSGGAMGVGSYGTAGGTTSILPMANISSNANNPIWPFQLLRSA